MSLAFKWVSKPEPSLSLARDKDPVFATPAIVATMQKRKQACRDTSKPQFWDACQKSGVTPEGHSWQSLEGRVTCLSHSKLGV
jgi:hypothetical protein